MPNTLTQNAQIIDEAVADIKDEIALKGVTVPDPCPITTIPSLIESISGGGGQDTQQLINMIERPQDAEIVVPEGTTKIGDSSFYQFYTLKKILMPNSITSIGISAFMSCTSLQSITLPNSITNISNSAFMSCTSLQSITLPNSITSIGYSAFRFCVNLSVVDLTAYTDSTSIPALDNINTFQNVAPNCVFLVANAEMQAAFSSATNWSNFTFTIQGA